MSERVSLGLEDDNPPASSIDLEELAQTNASNVKPSSDLKNALEKEGEKYGFISRQANRRPTRKRSPYIVQNNVKMRIGMKELFQEVSARLETYDQETLELALLSLIEKEGLDDLRSHFHQLVSPTK